MLGIWYCLPPSPASNMAERELVDAISRYFRGVSAEIRQRPENSHDSTLLTSSCSHSGHGRLVGEVKPHRFKTSSSSRTAKAAVKSLVMEAWLVTSPRTIGMNGFKWSPTPCSALGARAKERLV